MEIINNQHGGKSNCKDTKNDPLIQEKSCTNSKEEMFFQLFLMFMMLAYP